MSSQETTHISQSECHCAVDCPMQWIAQWHIGLRNTSPEGPAQRVGSLGHACLASHVTALIGLAPTADFYAAMLAESKKRKYIAEDADWSDASDDLVAHAHLASQAAQTLIDSPDFNVRFPAFSPLDPTRTPLIEQRLRVGWDRLRTVAGLHLPPAMAAVFARNARRLGMEGTPDIVHYEDAEREDSAIFLDDYKMRTKPVDHVQADNSMADPQGAFYKMLLAALEVDDGHRDVVFRQVNVYAGRWMTVEDFTDEGSPFVIATGLPTRDEKKLPGMVRPDVWMQAWYLLEERRRIATAGNPKGPRLPTANEREDARRFLDDLGRRKAVQVSHWRLEHNVCLEVVQGMLSAVAARLGELDASITPGRNLRTWQGSPCTRPFGCDVQSPCLASLGSNNAEATFRDALTVNRYRLSIVPDIGEHDGGAEVES